MHAQAQKGPGVRINGADLQGESWWWALEERHPTQRGRKLGGRGLAGIARGPTRGQQWQAQRAQYIGGCAEKCRRVLDDKEKQRRQQSHPEDFAGSGGQPRRCRPCKLPGEQQREECLNNNALESCE